jgi:hypothetical protein
VLVPFNPCLAKLSQDEPFFVLLGRDAQAPMAIEAWAGYREAAEGKSDWTAQAREVANSMRAYRIARQAGWTPKEPRASPAPTGDSVRLADQVSYSIDLQRIIEDLCGDRDIRTPQTAARHHYAMAVKYRTYRQPPHPTANEGEREKLADGWQREILEWAVDKFGPVALDRNERALRFVEEALELGQVEFVSEQQAIGLVKRVFSRSPGNVDKEIGQAALTLEALAENIGKNARHLLAVEYERIKSIPKEEWQRRHAAKVADGHALRTPATSAPANITINPPTPEQEEYLRKVEQATNSYDRNAVIGGPAPAVDVGELSEDDQKRLKNIRALAKNWKEIASDEEAAPTGSMLRAINDCFDIIDRLNSRLAAQEQRHTEECRQLFTNANNARSDTINAAARTEAAEQSLREAKEALTWRDISTAPKDRLIDIWIKTSDGGVRWSDAYHDHITDTWRTSRYSGHLVSVPAKSVTHWMELPKSPARAALTGAGEEGK